MNKLARVLFQLFLAQITWIYAFTRAPEAAHAHCTLLHPHHCSLSDLDPTADRDGDGCADTDISCNRHLKQTINTIKSHLNQGLVPPVIREYFVYLDRQASYKSLDPSLKEALAEKYSDVNLSSVRYAESVDTVHGAAITVGNKIYFPRRVNFKDYSDLHWLLHELEHVRQYKVHGGVVPFLAKYLVNGAIEIGRNGSINIHGEINLEREANAKANNVIDHAWAALKPDPNAPRYAVLCLINKTDISVNYVFKWGNHAWKPESVASQESKWHSHAYDYPGQNVSPNFTIAFDYTTAPTYLVKDYSLARLAAQSKDCSSGMKYEFRYQGGSRDNIDLYKIN